MDGLFITNIPDFFSGYCSHAFKNLQLNIRRDPKGPTKWQRPTLRKCNYKRTSQDWPVAFRFFQGSPRTRDYPL